MDKKKVKEKLDKIRRTLESLRGYNDRIDKLVLVLDDYIESAQKELSKSDWISVEDRLPEFGENVLAISKDGNMNVSYRRKIPRDKISPEVMDDNGFILNFNLSCSTITHWKPIEKLEE